MNILTAAEMSTADRRSVELGVPISQLMQNAGTAVARFCLNHYAAEHITVLCGKGNNGGDGMVAATELAKAGRKVRIALLGSASDLKKEPLQAFNKAKQQQCIEVHEVADEQAVRSALADAALILDAIVGTGFKPPLRGLPLTARTILETTQIPIVAIDLPSGWDADSTAQTSNTALRADAVVTFAAPKLAHVFGALTPGKTFGPVVVANIGTPPEAIESTTNLHWSGSAKRIAEPPRAINGNKGRLGHVMILGGAYGKAGAPSMASLAAMRTGAGLVTAAVPNEILSIVATIAPELMLTPMATKDNGLTLDQLEAESLKSLLKGISVVGIGPGLGQAATTPDFVRKFLEEVTLPTVIDADALNAVAGRSAWLKSLTQKTPRTLVLTPHPGEMARLLGLTVKEVEADRVNLARNFATAHDVTLVLKGWRTLIAHPDGRIAVNTTGNPSMAKGGSGDILTGIVAAMLAQYPDDVPRAVEAAVFLHGLAGDFACLAQDEHTVLATDTVAHLWQAFRNRVTDADGFTWLSGTATNGTATSV